MSSILEALKKLEAEKHASPATHPPPEEPPSFGGGPYFDDPGPGSARATNVAPLLWLLGGGVFTLLVIGVAVLLVMLLLQQEQAANRNLPAPVAAQGTAATPPTPEPLSDGSAAGMEAAAPAPPGPEGERATPSAADEPESREMVVSEVSVDLPAAEANTPEPADPPPAPAPEPEAESPDRDPAPAPTPVRETYTPPPPPVEAEPPPLPEDIRHLPMLSRSLRDQYRLEGIQLNMLNVAGPTRPLGNAFINLEKVFVGEILPGTNARLVGVASHGIAIEIQSTRQRYYIPR